MKEVSFIRQNIDRWRSSEAMMDQLGEATPDEMADAYIELTSDLAFAQSHYPRSRITLYLNNLSSALHNEIYRNKRERWSRLLTFWTREMPLTMYDARRCLLASALLFAVAVLVGVVSQLGDSDFCRLILGNYYVDMTLRNIEQGEPMAVYGGDNELVSFLGITINNVRVAFISFAMGLFTSFGTGFILLQNGIMVGTFQTFFFQHDVGLQSMLAIWLHGTIEISTIIVAGAAGIAMGNGWLFPGTYSRMASFRRGAQRGLRIVVGTVPLIATAAFIEGFATRHTEWPTWLRLGIIVASALFVAYYYIALPQLIHHRNYADRKD